MIERYRRVISSPLGELMIVVNTKGIERLDFVSKYNAVNYIQGVASPTCVELADRAEDWILRYFAKKEPAVEELPLNPKGGFFHLDVWDVVSHIPYGRSYTYGMIATVVAKLYGGSPTPMEVDLALRHNPLPIIIPCHRVVGLMDAIKTSGTGIWRKQWLMEHENIPYEWR